MAATIPTGYQNLDNGVWGKNIKIKGKTFQVVVNPDTGQKWLYEQDTFGNGKPLFTIDQNSKIVSRSKDANGNFVPIAEDDFSYSERKSDLNAAGITGLLLVDTLKRETAWANVQGTQPAPERGNGTTPGPQRNDNANNNGESEFTDNASGLTDLSSNFRNTDEFKNIRSSLYYPTTILNSGQDKIVISQYSYIPAPITTGGVESVQSNLTNRENQFKEWLGTATLPIPNELSEMNQVGWGENSISGITAALMGAGTSTVQNLSQLDVNRLLGNLSQLGGIFSSDAVQNRLKQFLAASASANVLKKAGLNVDPEAYITRVTGAAINPNLELLFNGPKLRPFSLTFKMSPRSATEATNIRSIIKFFKKGMSPKRSANSDVMFFLGSPNVFKIKFVSGPSTVNDPLGLKDLDSIGKFKTCALVSCGINYTPDGGYASFQDPNVGSQPISLLLSLSFIELTPIYSDEYEDSSTVGPDNFEGITFNSTQ